MKTLTAVTALTLLLSTASFASVPCAEAFQAADTSSDSQLSPEEIIAFCDLDSDCVTSLDNADADGDGAITYAEFVSTGLCSET